METSPVEDSVVVLESFCTAASTVLRSFRLLVEPQTKKPEGT